LFHFYSLRKIPDFLPSRQQYRWLALSFEGLALSFEGFTLRFEGFTLSFVKGGSTPLFHGLP